CCGLGPLCPAVDDMAMVLPSGARVKSHASPPGNCEARRVAVVVEQLFAAILYKLIEPAGDANFERTPPAITSVVPASSNWLITCSTVASVAAFGQSSSVARPAPSPAASASAAE